jgi:hypothetical protein
MQDVPSNADFIWGIVDMIQKSFAAILLLSTAVPVLAQGDAARETWWVDKSAGGLGAYKAPNRPIWRLSELKRMHAGRSNWSQQIILDDEQNVTYNSGAPGTRITPRMHPDTPTVFVIIAGDLRFTVEGQGR